MKPSYLRALFAALLGCTLTFGLVALWQRLGLAEMPAQPSANYPHTTRLQACLSVPFAALFAVVALAAGVFTRAPLGYAVGTVGPFLIAVALETSIDPSNHNLLPFEALFYWLPTFLVAWTPSHLVLRFRTRAEPPPLPPS